MEVEVEKGVEEVEECMPRVGQSMPFSTFLLDASESG